MPKRGPAITKPPLNARELAFDVLNEHHWTSVFAGKLLDDRLRSGRFTADERRLATEIVYGVIRRQATLNALIQPHVKRKRHTVEGGLWTLMQLGVYQAVFLTSVPPHAAVNETVEVAKRLGKQRWSGFLNGVLRSVARNLTDEYTNAAAADTIPIEPGRYRKIEQPAFADPRDDPCSYVARAFSFPRWLVERWLDRYDCDEVVRLAFWFNTAAKTCLRVNLLKTTRQAMIDVLTPRRIGVRAGSCPETVWLDRSLPVEGLTGFDDGWFSVQDESAMHAARLLQPQPGQTVLDLCAAPGSKTTHLAELMANRGRIIATDVNRERLALLGPSSRRLGIDIIEPVVLHADGSDMPPGPFDAILVDVPCSNTGVLAKRPEARWRLQPTDVEELAALGRQLLSSACGHLKPGGRIVYSTCSTEPQENSQVVQAVVNERPELTLVEELEHIPGRPADGGYQALCLANDSTQSIH